MIEDAYFYKSPLNEKEDCRVNIKETDGMTDGSREPSVSFIFICGETGNAVVKKGMLFYGRPCIMYENTVNLS